MNKKYLLKNDCTTCILFIKIDKYIIGKVRFELPFRKLVPALSNSV